MKQLIADLLQHAVATLQTAGDLPADLSPNIQVERGRNPEHGDFASNLALMLAKPAKSNPRALADKLVSALPSNDSISKTVIAGPGFINFFVTTDAAQSVLGIIAEQGDKFGLCDEGKGQRVQVEFVSANPTGPLHVGHGRGAAYGATVADLLEAVGFKVSREYYVNDAGRQMDILATSVWLRYLELCGEDIHFPANGYQGDYVQDIAATLHRENSHSFQYSAMAVFDDVPKDEPAGGDKERHIDGLINNAKTLLGDDHYRVVFDLGLKVILDDIRDDLGRFGIHYQEWYSERSLVDRGLVKKAVKQLQAADHIYEKKGALWFRSTDFGDEKDRVVVRDNGQATYFASDIAYHMDKFDRGFDRVINIWGADHHGYIPRVRAALTAMGSDQSKLDVQLVQFAVLYRSGEKVPMSTRSGSFVTLRQLRKEVGSDAARFFYVMRKCEQHMDFDLDLAKSQSNENPMYYIQYAHARVYSVLRQLAEKALKRDADNGHANLSLLTEDHEAAITTRLAQYPEILKKAALNHEPHQLVHYLRDLANDFHTYYNAHTFLVDDAKLRDARLNLIEATSQVLRNGLLLLGVSAPEKM